MLLIIMSFEDAKKMNPNLSLKGAQRVRRVWRTQGIELGTELTLISGFISLHILKV